MKILLASNNINKLREMRELLPGHELFTLRDVGIDVDVVEDGETFYDNALKKARELSLLSGMITVADDSGLVVNALGGAPGVHSARYSSNYYNNATTAHITATASATKNGKDNSNNELLLANMTNITDRSAYFISCIVLYLPSGEHYAYEGRVNGHILHALDGVGGFGYDPLFYCDELSMSFGSASSEQKNTVSHRARAINQLINKLNHL